MTVLSPAELGGDGRYAEWAERQMWTAAMSVLYRLVCLKACPEMGVTGQELLGTGRRKERRRPVNLRFSVSRGAFCSHVFMLFVLFICTGFVSLFFFRIHCGGAPAEVKKMQSLTQAQEFGAKKFLSATSPGISAPSGHGLAAMVLGVSERLIHSVLIMVTRRL